MSYLAAIEVDQRQRVILAARKLKELLGGSWTIENTKTEIDALLRERPATQMVLPTSGSVWLSSTDLTELEEILWACRAKLVDEFGLPCAFCIVPY
jgi:hypothetical protein